MHTGAFGRLLPTLSGTWSLLFEDQLNSTFFAPVFDALDVEGWSRICVGRRINAEG